MITFTTDGGKVLLKYTPERQENWIDEAVAKRPFVTLKKTFTLWRELHIKNKTSDGDDEGDYMDFDEFETSTFLFGSLEGNYVKVVRGILKTEDDVYFHKSISLKEDFFVADSNVAIFKVIASVYKGDVFIGGDNKDAIPFGSFENLLTYFPSNYERKKYVEARISSVFRNYFDSTKDAEKVYQKYLNKKLLDKGENLTKAFREYELAKLNTILEKLKQMLVQENSYSESQWQEEILQIVLLLYPKYIYVFKEVPVYAKLAGGIKEKFLDFLLVDNNGNTDIIEIKKPFENAIMTSGVYRDNFIPLRELSGTVMQIEKYIYYLNRWSDEGEKFLTNKYQSELPVGFDIKITNPNGIIIMGREKNLSAGQKRDFEVVKRKYKNVVDIITYDSLIQRLETSINQTRKL